MPLSGGTEVPRVSRGFLIEIAEISQTRLVHRWARQSHLDNQALAGLARDTSFFLPLYIHFAMRDRE